jgi:hypothetical protein
MKFDVNGIGYLLNFDPRRGSWELLGAGPNGVVRTPVVQEDALFIVPSQLVTARTAAEC